MVSNSLHLDIVNIAIVGRNHDGGKNTENSFRQHEFNQGKSVLMFRYCVHNYLQLMVSSIVFVRFAVTANKNAPHEEARQWSDQIGDHSHKTDLVIAGIVSPTGPKAG